MDKVEKYPSLLFNYTSNSETVNTSEKKQYNITTYAQWRIADPALFSLKLSSELNAENQLDNLIHPVIVQAINRLLAEDFISNKQALNQALKNGRDIINREMVIRGIEVTDIQVHRTILPQANVETTYDRMKADRAKVAQQLRRRGRPAIPHEGGGRGPLRLPHPGGRSAHRRRNPGQGQSCFLIVVSSNVFGFVALHSANLSRGMNTE